MIVIHFLGCFNSIKNGIMLVCISSFYFKKIFQVSGCGTLSGMSEFRVYPFFPLHYTKMNIGVAISLTSRSIQAVDKAKILRSHKTSVSIET